MDYMTRFLIVVVSVMSVWLVARPAESGEDDKLVLELRSAAKVEGDEFTLEDIIQNGEELPARLKSLRVGNSPWLGRERRVSPELVELRLAYSSGEWDNVEIRGADVCVVSRNTMDVGKNEIVEHAKARVRDELEVSDEEELTIELVNSVDSVHVPVGESEPELRADIRGGRSMLGKTRVDVSVQQDDERIKKVPVRLRVRLYGRVAVAARTIEASESVTEDQIAWRRRDVGNCSGIPVRDPDALDEKISSRRIPRGVVITSNMLKAKPKEVLVEAREQVRLVVETSSVTVSAKGRAVEQGREGDVITVMNLSSGKKVTGVVTSDGNVRVEM